MSLLRTQFFFNFSENRQNFVKLKGNLSVFSTTCPESEDTFF